jgi:hypothetical protein
MLLLLLLLRASDDKTKAPQWQPVQQQLQC